jgi:predicted lipoprotein with Yx(FWY)xxD motif
MEPTMKTLRLAPLALFLAAALAHAEAPVKVADGMVVNSAGMTVYTFDKDSAGSGKSACNGPCAQLWPPVMADASAQAEGDMSLVTRDDGARQWAWKGKPLYLYANDKKAGDKTGDNFKDVWHVIKP